MSLYLTTRPLFRNSLVFFAVYLLSACGGSQDPTSTDESDPDTPLIGTFVDSAVSGLHYATDTQAGITNDAGEYLFYPGESITFSVGSVLLPSAPATLAMTPLDLAGTDQLDNTVVINILQFLQTLDDDQNAENGIQLETASASINNLVVDFNDENFSSQDAVQQIVKIAPANTNNRLVDADIALEHFGSSLIMLADPPSSDDTNTASAGDEFYIVYKDQQYNGDMIIFSRKHFALTNDGQLSDGKYDASSNVWHLWNRKQRQHHFVMVIDTLGGYLETCWADTAKKAIDCNDEDATIAYLFSNESDAQSYRSSIEIGPEPTPVTNIEPEALPTAEREFISLAAAQAESTDAAEAAVIKTEDEQLAMQQAMDAEAKKEAARLAAEQAEADAMAAAEATATEELEKLAAEKREAEELEIARLAKREEEAALAAAALAAEELEAAKAAEEEKAAQLAKEKLAAEQAAAAKAAEEQKAAELAAAHAAAEKEAAELAAIKAAEEEAIAIAKAQAEKEAAEAAAAQALVEAEAAALAAAKKEAAEVAAKLAEEQRIEAEIAAKKAEEERLAAEQAEADRIAAERAEAEAEAEAEKNVDPSLVHCDAPTADIKAATLLMINKARSTMQFCGVAEMPATEPLVWNESLERAALAHAKDMATYDFFSHTGSDGLNVYHRATEAGYTETRVGENIASGPDTVERVHNGWMNSPGHCQGIMWSPYKHVGVACVLDVNERDDGSIFVRRYWAMVLGGPR